VDEVLKRVREVLSSVPGVSKVKVWTVLHVMTEIEVSHKGEIYDAESLIMSEFPDVRFDFVCAPPSIE